MLLAELQGLQGHLSGVLAQAGLLLHACQLQDKLCHPPFLPAQLPLLLQHLWHAFTFKAYCLLRKHDNSLKRGAECKCKQTVDVLSHLLCVPVMPSQISHAATLF